MPYLIECTTPEITYLRGNTVVNKVVNLDLCKNLYKSTLNWYPDNVGKPAITFDGCDVQWVFNTDKDRDAEFSRIIDAQPRVFHIEQGDNLPFISEKLIQQCIASSLEIDNAKKYGIKNIFTCGKTEVTAYLLDGKTYVVDISMKQ